MERIPKTSELYLNQFQMIRDLKLRTGLEEMVESASPDQLRSLVFIVTGQRVPQSVIESDLGSAAIETLLDHLHHLDHHQLHEIRHTLESQGVPI